MSGSVSTIRNVCQVTTDISMLRLLDVLYLNCSFTRNLPAGAPLLPATDTVHSWGFAGRSSVSSSDRKCCMSDLVYLSAYYWSLHTSWELLEKTWIFLGNFLYCSYLHTITVHYCSMSGCSRDISWLFNVRDSRWVLVETNTSLRSVVGGHFMDCLPTQHWTAASGELSNPGQG